MIKRPYAQFASPRRPLVGPVPPRARTIGARSVVVLCAAVVCAPLVAANGASAQSGAAPAPVQAAVTTPPPPADSTDPATAVPSTVAQAPATPRFSDPVADLAGAALAALRSRGGASSPAPTEAPTTVVAPLPVTQRSQVAIGTGDQTWSAVVMDTASLSDYFLGTAVAAPTSPKTAAVLSSLPSEGSARFDGALRQLAQMVADRTKVDPVQLQAVWSRTDPVRMRAVLTALAQVGTMYRYTGNQPGGFDCSGLTSYSWAQAGVKIPRTSSEQIAWAAPRSPDTIQPGDIVWRPGHVGLYLGVGDAMVHSPQTGKPVEVKRWGRITRWGSPVGGAAVGGAAVVSAAVSASA